MKVVIITACFNSEDTILDCISSVNNQTYSNIIHVFVDGKSSDSTVDIIQKNSTREKIVISQPDMGIYDAMNKGLNSIKGDIFCILNSDDIYENNEVIENITTVFKQKECDLLWSNLRYVSKKDLNLVKRTWISSYLTTKDIKKGLIPPHPTFFISNLALESLKGFDLKYTLASDFDFMKRAFLAKRLKKYYFDLFSVRMRLGGATNKSFKNIIIQNIEIMDSLRNSFADFSSFKFIIYKLKEKFIQFTNFNT